LKNFFRILYSAVKWVAVIVVCVEILSFTAITAANYILYGHGREGTRARYDPYTLFLVADGVQPTANNSATPSAEKDRTIWLFGGSTMRAENDPHEKSIPSFLSRMLNSEQRPLHFTLVNYGVNSFNSLMETKYLQKALIESPGPPWLVIFYDGANDAKYLAEHRTPYGHHGYRRVTALIESYYKSWFGILKPLNAAIYSSFTKELYDKINQVFIPLEPGSPLIREMAETAEARYDHVNKMVECYGARFLLIWQPMRWVEECAVPEGARDKENGIALDSDRYAALKNNFTVPYQAMAARLKDKPYFVDLRDALCGRSRALYRPDGVHLTPEGRKTVAREISRVLKQRFF